MKKLIAAGSCVLITLLADKATNANAAIAYWDPEGAVAAPTTAQLTGTWTSAGVNWSASSSGGTLIALPTTSAACFCSGTTAPSGSFTVTVSGTVSCAGLFNGPFTPPGFNVTLSGGTINLGSGTPGVCSAGSDSDPLIVSSILAGTGQVVVEGTDQLYLNGVNTYSGGTAIGVSSAYPNYFNSIVNFNNSASFGTGTITLTTFGNGSAFAAEGTSAITIPNNFTLASNVTNNFVGNAAGITYSGNWTMGANRLTFETGNAAANIDIVSGVLSGTGGFAVSNVGTLKLSGVNTYSGNTAIISPAVVILSGAGQLGSGTYAGNVTNGGAFIFSSSANQTLSGIISGAGTITNNGSGALTLSGVNTFTKGLAMNGGTLNINNNAALGTSAGTFTVTGGTIDNTSAASVTTANLPEAWNGDFAFTGTQPLNLGTGAVTPNASRQITVNGSTLTVGGVISSAFALTKAGTGTLALNGVNTYSGGTTISAGTLAIGGAGKLAAAGNITNNGTFTYGSSAALTLSGTISGSGALNENGSAALTLSGANSYTGISTVNTGGTLNVSSDGNLGTAPASFTANQITLNGGTLGLTATAADLSSNRGITILSNSTISASSGQSPSIEGIIAGSGILTKSSSGNLNLNGSNIFSGGFTITGGGVRFNNTQAAGTGVITVTPASIITLRTITPPAANSLTITNAVVLNSNGGNDIDLTAATGNTFTLSGPISGPGYFTRGRASGAGGNIVLSGSNSFGGGLLLEGGILSLGSSNALGTGALTISPGVNNPVILQSSNVLTGGAAITNPVNITLNTATNNVTISGTMALELNGPVGLSNALGATPVILTNNNSGGTIISGPISSLVSGVGLTVAGTGTLTLSGTNTYNGNTAINSGSVVLGANGSISNSPAIAIGATATFDVSSQPAFTLGASALSASGSISNSATINGASAGAVDLGSLAVSLSFQPTNFTGDATHPALVVSQGALNFNGNAITVNNSAATPLAAGAYALIQVTGGTITGAPSASVPTVGGSGLAAGATASISVNGGTVYLIVVEPPTFSNLTASQAITYGTGSITLGGTVSGPGPVYPTNGEMVTVTINGNPQTTPINDSTGDFSLSIDSSSIPASGSAYAIAFSYGGDTWLTAATDSSTSLTVNPASLTITANDQAKTYGQTIVFGPGSTLFTTSALSNSETVGTVTLSCSGGAANAAVTNYAITPSAATGGTFSPNNYSIAYVSGSLTVTPLTVVLAGTQVYDGSSNAIASSLSVFDAVGGDDVNVASGVATMASEDVGTNAITVLTNLVLGGTTAGNYSLAGASGAVVVTPLPVDLTGTRPYDGTNDAAATILALATNYDGTNLTVSGSALLAGSGAGVQAISDFTGLTLGGSAATNYTLSNAIGSVTITVTAASPVFSGLTASQSITYGAPSITLGGTLSAPGPLYPAMGGTITVTIDGDPLTTTIDDTNGDFTLSYASSTIPASGSAYAITYAYAGDDSFNAASDASTTLTVNPLSLILSGAAPYSGSASAAFGYLTIVNAINGDDVSLASGSVALAGAAVGTEGITGAGSLVLGGLTAGNYTLAGVSGTVTIGAVPLTITANPQSTTYGTLITLVGSTQFGSAGLQPGDSVGSVTLAVSSYTANTPIGSYTITPSAATGGTFSASNYTIAYVTNTLMVNPLPAVLAGTEVYDGTTNAASSILSVANAVGADDVNVASGTAVLNSADIGTNAIIVFTNLVLGGTTASNYTLAGASGTVTVTPLAVTLTGTRPYDGTATALSSILSVGNAAGTDDVNVASGSATLAGSNVGLQTVASFGTLALGGTTATNYTLAGATGSVSITNPYNSFQITSSALDATGTNVVVCWQSIPGVTYTVLTNTCLAAPQSWAPAGSPVTATNTSTCFTLPGGTGAATNAYIVIKQ